MRILLDESLPRHLAAEFPAHEVDTVRQMGWSSLSNGDLLERASGRFDVILTADQNLEHQQNLRRFNIAVVVLVAVNNRIESLRPLVPSVEKVLKEIKAGTLTRVSA
jgi:predicted nuclease of predicted toxin-antitoxin system